MFQLDIFQSMKVSQPEDNEHVFVSSNLELEHELYASGFHMIAGVDEAGRGPLAGPVVACACVLPRHKNFPKVTDSKALSEADRKEIYLELISCPEVIYAIGIVDHQDIDKFNILRATLLAMKQAVEGLRQKPDFVLVDGRDTPPLQLPAKAIVKGDLRSQSIGAASIIAKVERDALMDKLDSEYPQYGFKTHKGYGTKAHLLAIEKYGASPVHRLSFAPLKKTQSQEDLKLNLF
jgi:ribonuclease HII